MLSGKPEIDLARVHRMFDKRFQKLTNDLKASREHAMFMRHEAVSCIFERYPASLYDTPTPKLCQKSLEILNSAPPDVANKTFAHDVMSVPFVLIPLGCQPYICCGHYELRYEEQFVFHPLRANP